MKKPNSTDIFAILVIATAIYKIIGIANFDYYAFMFQQFSNKEILVRYCGSIIFRCLFLITGVGLLLRKEIFRRLIIFLGATSLIVLYWKHPPAVFYNIALYQEVLQGINSFPEGTITQNVTYPVYAVSAEQIPLKYPMFPVISLIFYSVIDSAFSAVLLFYFTRAEVRERFSV